MTTVTLYLHTAGVSYTVEPPNKGYLGTGNFVLCREVVLFSEVQIVLAL